MTKRFRNYYSHCNDEWTVDWDHMVNDPCPECGREIKPYKSEELLEVTVSGTGTGTRIRTRTAESGPERSDLREQAEELIIDGHIDDIRNWALTDTESLTAWLRNVLNIDNMTFKHLVANFRVYLDGDEEFYEKLEEKINGEESSSQEGRNTGQQKILG